MSYSRKIVYLLLLGIAMTLVFCQRDAVVETNANTYQNLQDSVAYMGMQTCRSCHNNIHQTFIETGMGQSFDHATQQKTAATYGAHAVVYDKKSNFYYQPFFRDSILYVMEYRLEGKDTIHKRIEKISYIVGSGHHTNSHIIDENGYIFQAPITFYTQEKKWDMAPGFEKDNLRFERFLTTECITCHNHFPTFVEGSLNKFESMPSGIECERCHGPGEIHVHEKLAGNNIDTSQYIDYSIVNPTDLSRELQMDLCQRCHLQGLAVLEEGKTFFDFKPGMELSSIMNVFLPRYTDSHEKFIMASQADRLRLSKCYTQSEMTCLTCHNPHHSVRKSEKNDFNKPCMSCHTTKKVNECSVPLAERAQNNNNCVSCHMPPSGSTDIPHINITDHYISKVTSVNTSKNTSDKINTKEKNSIARFLGLKILTKEKATSLDMARGYIAMYDKSVEADAILDSAHYYLIQANSINDLTFKTWIHYYFAKKDFNSIIQKSKGASAASIQDGWTAYRIGEAYLKNGDSNKALPYHKKATSLMPFNLDFQEKLGITQVYLQQLKAAQETFNFVLKENSKRPIALCNLGFTKALEGDFKIAEKYYNQAIQLDPDYEQALVNKAALLRHLKRENESNQLFKRVLKINPNNEQARQFLK